jgi:hypothetical protein
MRKMLLFVPTVLAACATAPAAEPQAEPEPPVRGESGYVCRSEGLTLFAGQEATSAVGQEILRVSGARRVRWVQPGMMVTMDYREDRVTVWLASGNRIERVNCG